MSERPPLSKIPRHVAIIMDGNGRWAKKRGLPRLAGHRAGTENIRRILEASVDFGIEVLTLWAFSTENWGRPKEEVRGLLRLLEESLDREVRDLHEKGVQIRHTGRLDRLPPRLQEKIREALELTRSNKRIILNVAFDYGGRAEIIQAVRRIIADGVPPEQVDEALFSRYLYTAGIPDPDLRATPSAEPVILLYTRFFEFAVERVVDIFQRVLTEIPQARLLVVGRGFFGEEERLKELMREAGIAERLVYVDWVEPEELPAYFAAADVAIYPYDDILINRTKCSVKLIDLMAAGVPVVADDVGQNREYIVHGVSGLLVPAGETNTFAASVVRLLRDCLLYTSPSPRD